MAQPSACGFSAMMADTSGRLHAPAMPASLGTHPACVEVERGALLVAVQDLLHVSMCEEDAAFKERMCGLAGQPLNPA